MGTLGNAYDNAMAQSFFATLECELINRRSWKTKAQARLAIFTWIESWYNPLRRHSGLGQLQLWPRGTPSDPGWRAIMRNKDFLTRTVGFITITARQFNSAIHLAV
jgi:transposase InsO family protein